MAEITNKLGKYILAEQLGSGAFGWVYKATDNIGRTVAIKVLKPGWSDDPNTIERFRREAQVAGGLFHNRIATILDFDESEGRLFLVMRYVDGVSLDKIIQQKGRLPWAKTLEILSQVVEGLDYAHQRGFVHRDIKPANILISEKEGAVLTDFGLVKAAEASGVSSSGAFLGTPNYIAPEIWSGKTASPATDVYSLACVATEMLTGKVLFAGENTPEILSKHVLSAPQLPEHWPEGIPNGLNNVLAHALEKDPAKRGQSVSGFVSDLRKLTDVSQRQAEAAEKMQREAEAQQEQAWQLAQAKAHADAAEGARRAAERRAQEAKRRTQTATQERDDHGRPTDASQKTFIDRFWPVGLVLLVVMLIVFLLGKSIGGTIQATSVPTATEAPTATTAPKATEAPTTTAAPAAPAQPAGEKVKIGLSFSDFANKRWKPEADLLTKLLNDKGYDVLVQEANHDVNLQNDQIDNMVTQGVKGMIIIAEDGEAVATAVDKAAKAGVKVIAYDRLIKTQSIAAYLSFYYVEIGRQEALGVMTALGLPGSTTWTKDNPAKVVMSGGSPTDNAAVLVRQGQMEIVQPYIDSGVVKIVADQWVDNWDPANALKMMENILTAQGNKIDAVVASNDGTALGELQALKAQGLAGKVPISGMDATADGCNSIVKGEQTVTVFKDIRLFAPKAVEMMDALIKGQAINGAKFYSLKLLTGQDLPGDIQAVFLPVVQVTKENVYEQIVKSGFQPYEAVYRDIPENQRPPKP